MLTNLAQFIVLIFLSINPAHSAVESASYDSFWIWSGVLPQPVINQSKTLYILQGEISSHRTHQGKKVIITAQGMSVPRVKNKSIWIVYRTDDLHWSNEIYSKIFSQIERWVNSENNVIGIQVDFDARTNHLNEYKDFLKDLRLRLPKKYQLSITGLMDWSKNADSQSIIELKEIVDEVVIQTYQGRKTIPNYLDYLTHLDKVKLPFKIGIIQGGEWKEPDNIKNNLWFRGYIVFLVNPLKPLN